MAAAALREQQTLNELASAYGVHPVQVAQWKKQALDELPHVFADHRGREARAVEEEQGQRQGEDDRARRGDSDDRWSGDRADGHPGGHYTLET